MSRKQRFKAVIDNRNYTIVGDQSAEHLNAVVTLVNQQLEQLKAVAPDLSTQDRAILMAINAISDQLKQEQRIVELEEKQLKTSTVNQPVKGHSPSAKFKAGPYQNRSN